MVVDPPIQHHEVQENWIPLQEVFAAVPEARAAFEKDLVAGARVRFDDRLPARLTSTEEGWLFEYRGKQHRLGLHPRPMLPVPPGTELRDDDVNHQLSAAINVARRHALSVFAKAVLAGSYKVHARFGSADSDFTHVARDIWARSDVCGAMGEAVTSAGTRLFNVHIEKLANNSVSKSPYDMLKIWLTDLVTSSPHRRIIKMSYVRGLKHGNSELYAKAAELGVAQGRVEPLKREVFALFPADIRKAWTKPGNSPRLK